LGGVLSLAALPAARSISPPSSGGRITRFDGRGYPRGLSGADISLEGRIASVADVFDAMTCDRVYRPAWSVGKAIALMRRERGRHFDPTVVDAFLAATDDVLAICSF
jgi:putative two-component system response regulator